MLFLEKQIGESIMYQIHRISFRSRFEWTHFWKAG
jgi:hypothetical protein